MEAIRKRMMLTNELFPPDEVNAKRDTTRRPSSRTSAISISSSSGESNDSLDSHSVGVPESTQGSTVIISDSEDEIEKDILQSDEAPRRATVTPQAPAPAASKAQPIHVPANPNRIRPQDFFPHRAGPSTQPKPIAIPTNHNLPRPVVERNYEDFDLHTAENTAEYRVSSEDADKALRDLMSDVGNSINQDIDMDEAVVPGFKEGITLLPHQIIGRKWMKERETGKRNGGILADDMGLGKTIQTITRIVEGRVNKAGRDAGYAKTTLVICPVAVVSQWASEIKKMAEGLTVIEHHGNSRATDPAKLKCADVVITSYSIVASEHGTFDPEAKDEGKPKSKSKAKEPSASGSEDEDSDDFGKFLQKNKKPAAKPAKKKDALFRVKWWRIVLDEAHNIKNRTTKSARACYVLDGKYRWCLTGTPMQNNVEELYSLLKFLRLRPLDDWSEFKEKIAQPIKNGRPQRAIKRLHVVLNACMLRRTKNTILNGKPLLDLPERIVNNVHCSFDPEEKHFYDNVQTLVQDRLEKLKNESTNMSSNYTSVLVLLLRLRQACNHPSLVSQDYRKDKEAVEPKAARNDKDIDDDTDDLADLIGGMGLTGAVKRCQMCQRALTSSNTSEKDEDHCVSCDELMAKARRKSGAQSHLPPSSAKIRMILKLLGEIEEREAGEKTIIFSQFTSMLDLIEPFLKAEGIKYVRYDGSMTKPDREEALRKIKTSKSTRVILISFKAGSTGLNLTCCNNVILVDLWWNPALEDQAFDRAHRLGQTRDVNIHKLSIPGTVEERILELQEKKRALATAALSGDKMKNMKLGMDDLMALFKHGGDDHDDEDDD